MINRRVNICVTVLFPPWYALCSAEMFIHSLILFDLILSYNTHMPVNICIARYLIGFFRFPFFGKVNSIDMAHPIGKYSNVIFRSINKYFVALKKFPLSSYPPFFISSLAVSTSLIVNSGNFFPEIFSYECFPLIIPASHLFIIQLADNAIFTIPPFFSKSVYVYF